MAATDLLNDSNPLSHYHACDLNEIKRTIDPHILYQFKFLKYFFFIHLCMQVARVHLSAVT